MRNILIFMLLAMASFGANAQRIDAGKVVDDTVYTVHAINQNQFRLLVADWEADEWNLRSERPVIVDFYADWCMPCRRLAPILQNIAQYYGGEVDFYRINVDKNLDIASAFEIRSIPYLLICPLDGEPTGVVGLYSEQEYIRTFNQALNRDQ